MGQSTMRDEVWKETLARTIKAGTAVRPSDIVEKTGASERMVRQCLLVISEAGWVERQADPNGEVRYVSAKAVDWDE